MTPKKCECGCGQDAPIATSDCRQIGRIKGKPLRFVHGHYQRWKRATTGDEGTGQYEKALRNEKVRRFCGMCTYHNPLSNRQILFLVRQIWPDYSASGLGHMLKRNCEGFFVFKSGKCISQELPLYWDDTREAQRLSEEACRAVDESEFAKLAEPVGRYKPKVYPPRQPCAFCREFLARRHSAFCSRECRIKASRPVRREEIPIADANACLREKLFDANHDELTQLSFSIAASISDVNLAELIGPVWEGLQEPWLSGVRDHRSLKCAALEFVKRHRRSQSDFRVASIDARKESTGWEPSRTADESGGLD